MLIHDTTNPDLLFHPNYSRGLVPRDFAASPREMFAPVTPAEIPLIPESEFQARIKEQEEQQSSLEHILRAKGIKSKNQNQPHTNPPRWGACWMYDVVGCVETAMVRDGQPYTELSAFGLAQQVMEGQDKGGWCGLAAERIEKTGVPTAAKYPEWDTNWKKYRDDASVWEDAAKYRITYSFRDVGAGHYYYQKLTYQQLISCLLLNIPCPCDFNWWSHSTQMLRAVWVDGRACPRGRNSWGDQWSDLGFFTLQGTRAHPDSALALVATTA